MRINRKQVIEELKAFAAGGNGVVVGMPGTGKTYSLSELVVTLLDEGVPAGIISLDALDDASDQDISSLLGTPGDDWIGQLAAIKLQPGVSSVLVFDAFDAVRDDRLKKKILNHIRKAQQSLPGWSVIASVRTYDAIKSPKLIDLFPQQYGGDSIHCRKFIVPHLSEQELCEVLESHPQLKELYGAANERLTALFRIPFFLSLLEIILEKNPGDKESLSVIKSEIELLDMFWVKVVNRVEPVLATEILVKDFTAKMVANRQLSVSKHDYLTALDTSGILIADQLLSENVLAEQGVHSVRLAFAHNIIFDYAVSKLLIKSTVQDIRQFINEDTTRPLFLRPSFIYHFTHLWYRDRELFWKIYTEISELEDESLQMFNKLIPSAVFVREFELAEDLPDISSNKEEVVRIRDIFQGFQYLERKADRLQTILLLERVSSSLQMGFVGEFAMVLRKFVDQDDITSDPSVFSSCGVAARNLFDYSFEHASDEGFNLDHLIANQAIPMVAITYGSDIPESRTRIEKIIDMVMVPGFQILYLSRLLDKLEHIYRYDHKLIHRVYLAVFNHEENGEEKTSMHASVIMNLTISRHDDYNLCRYRLKEFFPTYLEAFLEQAVCTSLQLVRELTKKTENGLVFPDGFSLPLSFTINGTQAHYQTDMSHWWTGISTPKQLELLTTVFDHLDKVIAEDREEGKIISIVSVLIANAGPAVVWRHILEWGAKHADKLHAALYEVLLQPAILYWTDTSEAARSFLVFAARYYNDGQLEAVENAINSLKDHVPVELHADCKNKMVRLLSALPREKLATARAKELLATKEPELPSPGFTSETFIEPYTERMHLERLGVDVVAPMNDNLLSISEELFAFFDRNRNGFADKAECSEYLEKALSLYEQVHSFERIAPKLKETLLEKIALTLTVILRSDYRAKRDEEAENANYHTIRDCILFCLSITTGGDAHAADNYSPGHYFNYTPRSSAAEGINFLFALTEDESLIPIIEGLAVDANPITRFGILHHVDILFELRPEFTRRLILERLEHEHDHYICADLIACLERLGLYKKDKEFLLNCLHIAGARAGNLHLESKFLTNLLLVPLNIYRYSGDEEVKSVVEALRDNHPKLARAQVFAVFDIIKPENRNRQYDNELDISNSNRLIVFLLPMLDTCKARITDPEGKLTEEEVREVAEVLNAFVTRIYFSLQVNERILGQNRYPISREEKARFYRLVKPLLEKLYEVIDESEFIDPASAYYFIQVLSYTLDHDPKFALLAMKRINDTLAGSKFTYDHSAMTETIKFTERLLADHRELLSDDEAFAAISGLLNIYAQVGWPEALQMLWQLDEVFR